MFQRPNIDHRCMMYPLKLVQNLAKTIPTRKVKDPLSYTFLLQWVFRFFIAKQNFYDYRTMLQQKHGVLVVKYNHMEDAFALLFCIFILTKINQKRDKEGFTVPAKTVTNSLAWFHR
jgi:hypothetical protein